MDVYGYWRATLEQDAAAMRPYFHADAFINWHNTNEHFTLDEYLRANCEYPGGWDGEVERVERVGDLVVTVAHVYDADQPLSFHVTSFFKLRDGRIASLDEYWGDDGPAPQWRLDKQLGRPIK